MGYILYSLTFFTLIFATGMSPSSSTSLYYKLII